MKTFFTKFSRRIGFFYQFISQAGIYQLSRYLFQRFIHRIPYHKIVVSFKDGVKSSYISPWTLQFWRTRKKSDISDYYFWSIKGDTWFGSIIQLAGLIEYYQDFDRIYNCNFNNKVVLDIGGYIGDTAKFALKKGAKKVIIYEPLPSNVQCISFNLQEEYSKIKLFQKAIGKETGFLTLYSGFEEGNPAFGLKEEEARYQVQCEAETFTSILKNTLLKENIDIAKVDCEGGEQFLIDVNGEILRRVKFWIIETHSLEVYQAIKKKFIENGFRHSFPSGERPPFGVSYFSYQTN